MLWCSKHVKASTGQKFLQLIDKHFPKDHDLHKICNRNTLKASYSCMNSMAAIILAHNSKIINKEFNTKAIKCKCRNKEECPVAGKCTMPRKCTIKNVIYDAKLPPIQPQKHVLN